MKLFKRILLALGLLIVLAIVAAFLYGRHIARRALPDYNASLVLPGLSDEVEVLRDEFAIPHVYAKSEKDLYMAVGYLTAQDRMWQMDLLRRATQGRLSEMFGADLVDVDHRMRSLHISEKSAGIYSRLSPDLKEMLDAYAAGVNQYLEDQGKALPPEFTILGYEPERWEPVHSLNLIGYMSWDLSMAWSTEIVLYKISKIVDERRYQDLLPDLSIQRPPIFPDFSIDSAFIAAASGLSRQTSLMRDLGLQVFNASNNWAVGPERSVYDGPILANDMHLGLFAPGLWYQMHQVVEGKLDVTGLLLPGQPLIITGHNRDIAWGMTNVMLDDIDFYLEKTDEAHPGQYYFDGEWRDFRTEKVTIRVKGGESAEREILYTHRGPVITDFKQTGKDIISMRWIGNEDSNEMMLVYLMNRARDWDDFEESCSKFIAIAQNINYADRQGNIGLHTTGGVPVRPGIRAFVSPGDSSLYDWTGLVPFDSLPHEYNPSRGYVSSANNKTAPDDYPFEISHWYDLPFRITRIREMIESKPAMGIEDFILMQGDQQSVLARNLNPLFVDALQNVQEARETAARDLLASWDHVFEAEASAPLLFEALYRQVLEEMFLDELGEEMFTEFMKQDLLAAYVVDRVVHGDATPWCDDLNTPDVEESFSDLVVRALPEALDWIEERSGSGMDDWAWGDLHTLTLAHPMGSVAILDRLFNLNRGPFPVGGSYHTVSPFSFDMNEPFAANHGASHRHIFLPGDWDKSLTVIPTGISGIPASKHYCDQTELYLNMQYHPDPFSREAVEAAARYRMSFKP